MSIHYEGVLCHMWIAKALTRLRMRSLSRVFAIPHYNLHYRIKYEAKIEDCDRTVCMCRLTWWTTSKLSVCGIIPFLMKGALNSTCKTNHWKYVWRAPRGKINIILIVGDQSVRNRTICAVRSGSLHYSLNIISPSHGFFVRRWSKSNLTKQCATDGLLFRDVSFSTVCRAFRWVRGIQSLQKCHNALKPQFTCVSEPFSMSKCWATL